MAARTGERFDVVNPADKRVMHSVPYARAEDVDDAVRAAHDAFKGWSRTSAHDRTTRLCGDLDLNETELS